MRGPHLELRGHPGAGFSCIRQIIMLIGELYCTQEAQKDLENDTVAKLPECRKTIVSEIKFETPRDTPGSGSTVDTHGQQHYYQLRSNLKILRILQWRDGANVSAPNFISDV